MQIERVNISIDVGFTLYKFGSTPPCLVLVSGVDRASGCGTAILKKIIEQIKDKTIHGTLIIIPQFCEHEDLCKGKGCRDDSEVFCRLIDRFTSSVSTDCVLVEIRCKKDFIPHVIISDVADNERFRGLVDAIPIEYVVKANIKGFSNIIKRKGYKTLTIIFKGGKDFDLDDVLYGVNTIIDMISNLGLLKKRKGRYVQHMYFNGYYTLRCLSKGIFIPSAIAGANITSKNIVGTIDDTEIFSPVDGVVLYISRPKLCSVNDVICVIALKS